MYTRKFGMVTLPGKLKYRHVVYGVGMTKVMSPSVCIALIFHYLWQQISVTSHELLIYSHQYLFANKCTDRLAMQD